MITGNNISVVCTTFNDQDTIIDLIEDILKQSIKVKEMIIADGGSKDKTVEIIKQYKDHNITVLSGKRMNISEGLNAAIERTTTDYVAIVMAGNRYDNKYLENLCAMMSDNCSITYPPIRGNVTNNYSKTYNNAFLNGSIGSRIPSNHGGLIKRAVFEQYGLFYEKFIYAGEDAEFYDRLRKKNVVMDCVDDAHIKWEIPTNEQELKKQVRAYMIANNQIKGFRGLWMFRFISLRCLIYCISITLSIFVNPLLIVIGLLVALIEGIFEMIQSRYDLEVCMMKKKRTLYQFFYSISNIKYMQFQYRVNPDLIKRLN